MCESSHGEMGAGIRDAIRYFKLWAKATDVSGSDRGRLSSYAIALMAIYALQVKSVIPVLDTMLFLPGEPPVQVPEIAGAAPELVAQIFRFYARDFNWGSEVVSVRLGADVASEDVAAALSAKLKEK